MLSSMCPMVTLLPASTVLLTLVLFILLRGPLMLPTDTEDTEDTATWVTLDTVALSHMLTPLDPTSLMLSSMCPMVMLLPASTVLLTLVLFTLLRGPLTLTLPTDTEDTEDTATWVTLDTVALSHMLTPLDPTSLMLSSMCPMVMLLLASTVLLTLVLSTLLRGTLTLSTDTKDTEDTATWVTLDMVALSHMLTPLDPTSPMLSSMCPMVMLLPASTVLLTLVLSTLLRGPPTLMLSTDTEDTATWVTLDMAALSHMLTPQDPTSLMLSSMCPMVTLLPASTVLLMLVLFTLLRGPLTLTLSTDTEDTDTPDL